MVNDWMEFVQRLIYPPICVLCGAAGQPGLDLCSPCEISLPRLRNCCSVCGLPLAAALGSNSRCGQCLQRPPPFDQCLTPFAYAPPVDRLVGGLKFRGKLHYGRLLARLLGDFLEQRGDRVSPPDLILPVPLHAERLRERGFNQSLELARHLGRRFCVAVDARACIRVRSTASQSTLAKQERARNIRGAFEVLRPMRHLYLALVDDVVTTGSTAAELTRLLKRRGAARVDIWAVARTP